eukprot:14206876-Ditylum_brightwellii.AAC.1
MKALVNKLTEVAVTKLTMQTQANMTTINTNITALITDMKEASRGLMYATGHNQTRAQIIQESQNSANQQMYSTYAQPQEQLHRPTHSTASYATGVMSPMTQLEPESSQHKTTNAGYQVGKS